MYKMRVLSTGKYDDRGYSNEESIANLQLTRATEINAFLTYNYGMDDDRFPLTFMTEGQGKSGVADVETIQWYWDTMGRMDFTDMVTYFNPAITQPGIGGTEIEVHFATHKFIEQYGLVAPDSVTQVRIQKDLGATPHGYGYILKLSNPNPTSYIDPANLVKGKYWSLTAPTVSESYSKGNRSNSMGPGRMTSQMEVRRFTKEIAGNLANVVTKYQFKDGSGKTNNLWINEEMRQFQISNRIMNEERLWMAEYNRDINGQLTLSDKDNGKPVPHMAGMLEICRESNYDTYGDILPLAKIKRAVGDLLDRDTDTGSTEVVLFGGKGFIEDFDNGIAAEVKDSGFLTPFGDKLIGEENGSLTYGKYFRKYKTIEGHTVTVKHAPFFDRSSIAEMDKKNGNIHPRTSLPMFSHQACIIDFSVYNGNRNVRLVRQKNNAYTAKVFKGMSDVPASWGVSDSNFVATDIDMSKYEIKMTSGLQVDNSTKMMLFKAVL